MYEEDEGEIAANPGPFEIMVMSIMIAAVAVLAVSFGVVLGMMQ
jgi:hypothetical protein